MKLPPGAYKFETLGEKLKKNIIEECQHTEEDFPLLVEPYFSTLGSIKESSIEEPLNAFVQHDSIRDLSGFDSILTIENHNISPNPVDILSFDKHFLETGSAQGLIFKGERTGTIHIVTIDVDPNYIYIEKFRGGNQWYKKDIKNFSSKINFKVKKL